MDNKRLKQKIKERLSNISEVRKEDDLYYQGPFWIIAETFLDIQRGNFQIIGEKYACNYAGEYTDTSLSKSARTHAKIWKNDHQANYGNVAYDYYPRGRVAVYQGIAFIHIHSKCNIPKIIDKIIEEYSIQKLQIEIDLNDTYQGSHYDFKLK